MFPSNHAKLNGQKRRLLEAARQEKCEGIYTKEVLSTWGPALKIPFMRWKEVWLLIQGQKVHGSAHCDIKPKYVLTVV